MKILKVLLELLFMVLDKQVVKLKDNMDMDMVTDMVTDMRPDKQELEGKEMPELEEKID